MFQHCAVAACEDQSSSCDYHMWCAMCDVTLQKHTCELATELYTSRFVYAWAPCVVNIWAVEQTALLKLLQAMCLVDGTNLCETANLS